MAQNSDPASRRSSQPVSAAVTPLPEGWLEVGKIVAAQGIQGEVRVYPETDFPERFEEPGQRWLLYPGQTEPQPVELVRGRDVPGKGLYVIQLAGIANRDQAEALKGCKILVPDSDRPTLEEGEFHVVDLLNLEVWDQATQTLIGTVIDVIPAGNDLLEVELVTPKSPKEPTVLIPFVKAIVPVVDLAQGRVEITPPAGLID